MTEEEELYLECGCCGLRLPDKIDRAFDESDNPDFCDVHEGWLEIYAKNQLFENLLYLCPECTNKVRSLLNVPSIISSGETVEEKQDA